jgi:hypothetical protein
LSKDAGPLIANELDVGGQAGVIFERICSGCSNGAAERQLTANRAWDTNAVGPASLDK